MMKLSIFSKGVALFAAPFLCFPQALVASKGADLPAPETIVGPSSDWALDYSDDSCRVGRFFGEGDQRILLQMTQFEPDHSFMLAIAGQPLGRRLATKRTRVRFGPIYSVRKDIEPTTATIGSFKYGLIFPTMSVRDTMPGVAPDKASEEETLAAVEPADPITLEDEAKVKWIELWVDGKAHVRLAAGPMGNLFSALNNCSEELLTHWGLDLERHRTASRKVVPLASPGKWIGSKDYPARELRASSQALVYFRLMVGEDGLPYSCHIQQSGYSAAFDKSVCAAMMRNARFEPALDAAGKPMKSYFRTSVRFATS